MPGFKCNGRYTSHLWLTAPSRATEGIIGSKSRETTGIVSNQDVNGCGNVKREMNLAGGGTRTRFTRADRLQYRSQSGLESVRLLARSRRVSYPSAKIGARGWELPNIATSLLARIAMRLSSDHGQRSSVSPYDRVPKHKKSGGEGQGSHLHSPKGLLAYDSRLTRPT